MALASFFKWSLHNIFIQTELLASFVIHKLFSECLNIDVDGIKLWNGLSIGKHVDHYLSHRKCELPLSTDICKRSEQLILSKYISVPQTAIRWKLFQNVVCLFGFVCLFD